MRESGSEREIERRSEAEGERGAVASPVSPSLRLSSPPSLRPPRPPSPVLWPLASVLLVFVALALGYALVTPAWNNPDEPAHYNYILHLATTGELPELRPGDWDAQRLEYLKTYHFPPDESIAAIRYESHQPPLYYLLAAPVLLVGQLLGAEAPVLALRGLSILLGVLLVLVTYRMARTALLRSSPEPHEGEATTVQSLPSPLATHTIPLLAAGLVAFIPMHTAMSAAINNDALANLLSGCVLLAVLQGMERGASGRAVFVIGLLAGALLLTKLTTYGLVALALAVVALIRLQQGRGLARFSTWSGAGRALSVAVLAMALVSAWWGVRQGLVYGWGDLLAAQRHDLVVAGQPRWGDLAVEPLSYFATTLFHSFWAQFGWMGITVDDRLYRLFGLFTALALFGLSLRLQRSAGQAPSLPRSLSPSLLLLAAACLVVFAEVVYYNLTFIQPQGRYLFPALAPLATLLAVGWASLIGQGRIGQGLAAAWLAAAALDGGSLLLGAHLPERLVYGAALAIGAVGGSFVPSSPGWPLLRPTLALGVVPALGLLDLVCLTRAVLPAFGG